MLKDHNLPISEQEYRDLDYPSYSMLSSIAKQGIDVMFGVKNNSINLKFGSLVDDLCFMPNEYVLSKYYCGQAIKTPTSNVKKIVDIVLEGVGKPESFGVSTGSFIKKKKKPAKTSHNLEDYEDAIINAAKVIGVYKNYTREKTISTVVDAGKDYFRDVLASKGKVLIKPEMWDKAFETANTLATHPFSSKYFNEGDNWELFFQYKFKATVNGIETKGMLDVVAVDHENKIIYPVDLKTGELQTEKFGDVFLMYNYYIQAGLYKEALRQIAASDPDLKDYTVADFEFVYISKENIYKPIVWVVPEEIHQASLNGFTDRYGYKNQGVYGLLKKYDDCKHGRYCNYTKEVYENEGRIMFDKSIIREENEFEKSESEHSSKQKFNISFASGK